METDRGGQGINAVAFISMMGSGLSLLSLYLSLLFAYKRVNCQEGLEGLRGNFVGAPGRSLKQKGQHQEHMRVLV